MKRVFPIFLLCAILASCGSETAAGETTNVSIPDETVQTGAVTVDPASVCDLPADGNLEGFTLRVIQENPDNIAWALNTIAPEAENGDVLNDVIFRRNVRACDHYNFKVEPIIQSGDPSSAVKKSVLAQSDEYDMALIRINLANSLYNGIVLDLFELPNLDLSKNYWDQNTVESLAVKGKLFCTTGDIIVSENDAMQMLTYNKAMADDYDLPDLYEMTKEGKWTFDKMKEYIRLVAEDLDGNGTWDEHDRYGLMYADNAAAAPYFAAADAYLYEYDSGSDYPVYTADSERSVKVFEIMNEILSDRQLSMDWSRIKENQAQTIAGMLENKQALFQSMVLSMVRRNYRNVSTNFGMLPLPKLDEAQDGYHAIIGLSTPYVFVPASITKPEEVGFALEALASESADVTTTYFNVCMESKYTRDKETYEMIDLVRNNLVYDVGFVYDWGNIGSTVRTSIMKDGASYISTLASIQSKVDDAMRKFMDELN